MAQFSVHRAPKGKGYVLNVQTAMLDHLDTRVVIPLVPIESVYTPTKNLNPIIEIEGKRMVLATHYIAAIPANQLKTPIAHLDAHHHQIIGALDFLVQGF